MTEQQQPDHGVDLETFEAFAEHAAAKPEAVQFELGANPTYDGACAHSLAKIDRCDPDRAVAVPEAGN